MTLTADYYRKKACDELRETEKRREEGIKELREWITKNPYILNAENFDDVLLLALLRARKYHMDAVFESAEKFAMIFAQFPDWFDITPAHLERSLQLIDGDIGVLFRERDAHGRRVFLVNVERAGEMRCEVIELIRTIILAMFFLLFEEETQVCGISIVLDCSRLNVHNIVPVSVRTLVNLADMIRVVPVRIKEVHVVGVPKFIVAVYEMMKGLLTRKLRARIRFHKADYQVPTYTSEDVVDARKKAHEMSDVMERLLKIKVDGELLRKHRKKTRFGWLLGR